MGKQQQRRERDARRVMDEGARAYLDGQDRSSCPYHSRVEFRELWIRGFEQAAASAGSRGPVGGVEYFGRSR